jgi:hypothetical protein
MMVTAAQKEPHLETNVSSLIQVTTVDYRPVLSTERALQNNKPVTS